MIEGMKFSIKGVELSALLAKRSTWHRDRAELLKTKNLKEAQEGMKAAAKAAVAANGDVEYGSDGDVEVVSESYSPMLSTHSLNLPHRSHGGSIEDPVAAIKKAIAFHAERGASLDFYSKHLVNEATYVLTESDVQRFELIAAVEQG